MIPPTCHPPPDFAILDGRLVSGCARRRREHSARRPEEKRFRRIVVKEKGVVKWFNAAKGYGFIQRSTGEDVFVHHSAIQMNGYRTLDQGMEVEFEVKNGPKGLQAENVNRL
jgi:CspA family cold shock protein